MTKIRKKVSVTRLEAFDIVRAPVISEKASLIADVNQVMFDVAPTASKPQIKAAIETLFGVKVKAVNTLVRKG